MKHRFVHFLPCLAITSFLFSCAAPDRAAAPSSSAIPWNGPVPPASAPDSRVNDIVTGGLRSGDQAINRNNIDSILNNPAPSGRYPRRESERSGLATGWGDEKVSRIYETDFARASSKPAGTDSIFYNNKEGIKAMANLPASVKPLQPAAGGLIEWGVKGGAGYLPAYKEYGFGRRMVAGEKGTNYSIFVRNRSKVSLEIVASVDGLDVQDGRTASFSKRGYIIRPGSSVNFEGFRTSDSTVAAFKFSSVSNSYANLKHGDTRNVGVIGIAVFTEKNSDPWLTDEARRRGSARAFAEAP